MKKFFTGVIASLLLTAFMGTTVYAFPSPTDTTALNQLAQSYNDSVTSVGGSVSGRSVTVTKNKPTATQVTNANAAAVVSDSSAQIMAMSNLTVPAGTDTSKGITITLNVSGVRAGDNVYVLHQKPDGTWEMLKPGSVFNGGVTVTLTSLSPVAVVKYNPGVNIPVSNPSGTTNTTTNNTNSNNTTGDTQNNSQTNNNNQNNTQNNPVNVNQNVTVNYPDDNKDDGDYDDGYADGYEDGKSDASSSSSGSSTTKGSGAAKTNVKSPKTGEGLPVVLLAGLLAAAGIGLAGKKLR